MRLICGTLVSYSWELPVSKILYNLQLLSSSLPTNFPSIWAMLVCQNIRFVCFGTMFNKVIVFLLSALAQFMLVIFIYITYLTSSKRGLKVLYYITMSITLPFVFFCFFSCSFSCSQHMTWLHFPLHSGQCFPVKIHVYMCIYTSNSCSCIYPYTQFSTYLSIIMLV